MGGFWCPYVDDTIMMSSQSTASRIGKKGQPSTMSSGNNLVVRLVLWYQLKIIEAVLGLMRKRQGKKEEEKEIE